MTREQVVPAFICALIGHGVDSGTIMDAIGDVRGLQLGKPLTDLALRQEVPEAHRDFVRAFAFEQAKRLERVSE